MSDATDPLDRLGTVHLIVGLVTVVAFILTGQYMDKFHDHMRGTDDVTRMLYRSTHLYILYAGLLNGAVGIGWRRYAQPLARLTRMAASLLLLSLPVLLLIAFFTEPGLTELARPYTRPATYAALAGGALLLIGHVLETELSRRAQS